MKTPCRYLIVQLLAVLCATFSITSHCALLAQTPATSGQGLPSVQTLPSTSAPLINTYYNYPRIELWDPGKWASNKAKAAPIAQWITLHEKGTDAEYKVPAKYNGVTNFVGTPDYNWKTESITDPDVTAPLTRAGLQVDIREGGGLAIFVAPEKVLADKTHKVPILFVPHVVDKMDVFWAMNALVHFRRYNDLCAQRGDFIVVYVVIEKSRVSSATPLNNTAIETASDIYRGDYKRLYLDMSVFAENNSKVEAVPGLSWLDDNGKKVDPRTRMQQLGFIPVLNVAGLWAAKPAAGIGIAHPRPELRYDPQRILHGIIGEHWIEGIRFLYDHGKDHDPAVKAHFEQMGLLFGEQHTAGERWLIFSPKRATEESRKLPLVLVLLETYDFNEYAASTAYAEYLDYFKLAAQGDLNVLFFSLESPETMDLASRVLKEAENTYPIDPSRIYVTGHSHNGHLAREFAYRHPDLVAAVAPLGNSSGLAAPAYSHEAVVADDEHIREWSKIDMPIVTIGAASEVTSPHSMPSSILNDYGLFIEAWQRRLTASRCPMKSREEIMQAEHSSDYVTRIYGLPNDGSSLQVIDGVEHYIIDIKNIDGRTHLRIVGVNNMVHTPEPTMPMVAWTFMRRFARDQTTGKVIELY